MTPVPPPSTVSPAARRWLRSATPPRNYPALDDTASWEALVAELEGLLRQRVAAAGPPTVVATVIDAAGVPVHVVRADGVSDDAGVHLALHGGSLIIAAATCAGPW